MEQIWVWGFLTILWTSISILRQMLRLEARKLIQFKKVVKYQFRHFILYDYKLWALPLLALFVFYLTKDLVRAEVLQIFFWTNVFWWFSVILLTHLLPKEKLSAFWQNLFFENSPLSWIAIWGALLINTYLLHQYHTFFGNLLTLLALLSCVFLGVGFVLFAFRWWQYGVSFHPTTMENNLINNDRLSLLLTALLSAVMLSQVYGSHSYFALMPLTLAAAMLAIFTFVQYLTFRKVTNLLISLAMAVVAIKIILNLYLPEFWLKDGKDYYRSDLFYSLSLGLMLSFFADRLIRFYLFLQEKYTFYFLDKPVLHRVATYLIRGFITVCLVAFISWGVLYAYKNLELYGLTLLLIVIFANINAKISFDIPAKYH